MVYDSSGRVTQIIDPIGRTVQYTYDGQGRLQSVTDPPGGVTRYTYDASHRVLTITDPRNITFITNEYDPSGRVVRQVQADGGVWGFAYTAIASTTAQTVVTDPRGNTTTDRFNSQGLLLSRTDALGGTTTYEYVPGSNLLLSTVDPLGRATRREHDALGNLTRGIDPTGKPRAFTYELTFNRVTSITDPLNRTTSFDYDAGGNLTGVVDALGQRTEIGNDAAGQPTSVTDPLANTTRFEYDAVGNLTGVVDPLGNRTSRQYDGVSRIVGQTDARGRSTTVSYDSLDRLVQILNPLGGITQMTYDGNGNLLTVTDPLGRTITHSYDSMDRLITRTDGGGRVEQYEYDVAGNLVRHTGRNGRVRSYTHDALNRRVGATYGDGSGTALTYDAASQVVEAMDSLGGAVARQFDALGRLIAETTPNGTVTYGYDVGGRRVRLQTPAQPVVMYTYDGASRLAGLVHGAQAVQIQYDSAGRRTRLTLPNGVTTESQYDAASRLIGLVYRSGASLLGDLTYQYDATGAVSGSGGTLARTGLPDPVSAANYEADNRQVTFGGVTATYDGDGNLTTLNDGAGISTYTWDGRNRLAGLEQPGLAASFTYDASGRRLSKTINGATTQYLYDGPDVAEEAQAGAHVPYLRLFGPDAPVARGGQDFYLSDGLGSILGLTDAAGTLVTRYIYEPFGGTEVEGAPSSNPFQFTGRENDGTGLYYYRARYYEPALHRFLGQDLVLRLGANRYAYAGNTPTNAIDPFGLDTTIVFGGSPSLGPGGSSARIGDPNPGLRAIERQLREDYNEPTAIFNSGQHSDIMRKAQEIVRTGRPLHIIGHSLGGQRAVAVLNDLLKQGIAPDHVFTVDPFIADGTTVAPGAPVTNFYQLRSLINGRPIENATNIQITDPGIGHFSITGHDQVLAAIGITIVGRPLAGGGFGGRY